MSKFNAEQEVLVLGCASGQLKKFIGKIGKVRYVYTDEVSYNIMFPDHEFPVYAKDGELQTAEDKTKFHKHHDLIIAWAKDTSIQLQWRDNQGCWHDFSPYLTNWNASEVRIKPEPKPDVVQERLIFRDHQGTHLSITAESPNVRYVFDGETGKLKAVELIP